MATISCFLTGNKVDSSCPHTNCWFNTQRINETHACVFDLIKDAKTATERAAILVERGISTKSQMQAMYSQLDTMSSDLHYLSDNFPDREKHQCPSCSYLRQCSSASLCETRVAAIEGAVADTGGKLTAYQLWHGAIENRLSFLSDSRRQDLQALVTAKDTRPSKRRS